MALSQILKESEIDRLLIGNPQITYFKSVFRRHTPFYKGVYTYQEHDILNENPVREELSHGTYDLITNIFLETNIIQGAGTIYANLGNNIVEEITFNVGGNALCTVEGLYMEARAELDHPYVPSVNSNNTSPPIMVTPGALKCNTGSQYNVQTMAGGVTGLASVTITDTFYTYPNFYFCRDYGSAFPICALNSTDVVLEIKYRDGTDITGGDITTFTSTVNVEYVNLSDDERLRFINNTDMYIFYDILPLFISNKSIHEDSGKNHPIRQIFFVGTTETLSEEESLSTPVSLSNTPIILTGINIKINSKELYETPITNLSIFTKQNINRLYPGYGRELATSGTKGYWDSIGVHSFCLDTTNTPSGHLSTNTPFTIDFTTTVSNIQIYLEVIKFYRIMGGQLGLLYI